MKFIGQYPQTLEKDYKHFPSSWSNIQTKKLLQEMSNDAIQKLNNIQ